MTMACALDYPPRRISEELNFLRQLLVKELRFDQQFRDGYCQGLGNCVKGLEPGRLFTLLQPHQCYPPDVRGAGARLTIVENHPT